MWNVSEYSLWEQRTKILKHMYVFWKLVHISSCVIEDFSFGLTITDFCHLLKSSFRWSKGVFTPLLPNQFKSNSGSFSLVKFICAIAFGPVHNSWTETLWRQWSQNELQSGDQTTIQLNCQMYAKVWSDHLWVAKYVLHSVTFYHKYSEVTKFKLIILYYFYCSCPMSLGRHFGSLGVYLESRPPSPQVSPPTHPGEHRGFLVQLRDIISYNIQHTFTPPLGTATSPWTKWTLYPLTLNTIIVIPLQWDLGTTTCWKQQNHIISKNLRRDPVDLLYIHYMYRY